MTGIVFARLTLSGNHGGRVMNRTVLTLLAFLPALALAQASCRYESERISGLNKICTYKCSTGEKSITVKATESCPRSLS